MLELRTSHPAVTIIKYLEILEKQFLRALNIFEIGSIENVTVEALLGDGHSTLYIAKWLASAAHAHNFTSIDLSQSTVKEHLTKKGLDRYVKFIEKDWNIAINDLIASKHTIDFLYLDAGNEPLDALAEFKAFEMLMQPGGIILIDDIDPSLHFSQKGKYLLEYLKNDAPKSYGIAVENGMMAIRVGEVN
jgi:predicted O-methyltransferase YrrM